MKIRTTSKQWQKSNQEGPVLLKVLRNYHTSLRIAHLQTSTYNRNNLLSYVSPCNVSVLLKLTSILTNIPKLYLILLKNKKAVLKHIIFPYQMTTVCSCILV